MKSYTDIEQSKKLAEILKWKTADMTWVNIYDENHMLSDHRIELIPFRFYQGIGLPAWSLAALLSVIPKHIKDYNVLRIDISDNDFAIWYDEIGYGVNNDLPNITMEFAVDACYEMIIKLYELNLL